VTVTPWPLEDVTCRLTESNIKTSAYEKCRRDKFKVNFRDEDCSLQGV
jgi:hypothetical protein